jgi:hypothetical protein
MNERIKQLDKAAQEYAGTIAGNDEDSNYVEWFNIYKEKLAELIVRECARFVYDAQPDGLALDVLEHFGVE